MSPLAELTVAPFRSIPTKPPAAVPAWLASRVRSPSAVVMLDPEPSSMFFVAVRDTLPVPPAARSEPLLGKLMVAAAALSEPAVMVSGAWNVMPPVASSVRS